MSKTMALIVLGIFLIDMLLTYRYVKAYKKMYPKSEWYLCEANPILKSSMKAYGLEDGMVIGGFILGMMLIIILTIISVEWQYFLFGLYSMVNIFHLVNWKALERLIEQKGGKKK